jgi:hypothetical protein
MNQWHRIVLIGRRNTRTTHLGLEKLEGSYHVARMSILRTPGKPPGCERHRLEYGICLDFDSKLRNCESMFVA